MLIAASLLVLEDPRLSLSPEIVHWRETNKQQTYNTKKKKKKKVRGGASVLFLPLKLGADADGEVASPQGS